MGGTGPASYSPGMTDIVEAVDLLHLKMRLTAETASEAIHGGAVEGSPEGVVVGWTQGDYRFSTNPVALWMFYGEPGTMFGWQQVDAAAIGPVIDQLVQDITILQAQVIVLQGDVTVLQNDVTILQQSIAALESGIVANFDFTSMGNIALPTGDVVLTDTNGVNLTFTALQQGTTFDILQGTGLRFRADAGNTQFTLATRTAASLLFLLGNFFAAYGVGVDRDISVTMYCSQLTIPSAQASPAGVGMSQVRQVNIPVNPGVASVHGYRRNNTAGTQSMASYTDNTGNTNAYSNPAVNANTKVIGLNLAEGAMGCFVGDWDTAGGQSWEDVVFNRKGASFVETTTANQVWKDQSAQIAMFFATGNANANMSVDVERLVIRAH